MVQTTAEVAAEIREALDAEGSEARPQPGSHLKGLAGNLCGHGPAGCHCESGENSSRELEKKTPPAKKLKLKFSELENALDQALESLQSLGASAEEKVSKLSDEEIAAIPSEFAQDIAKRIRDAAEMGDVTTLKCHRRGN